MPGELEFQWGDSTRFPGGEPPENLENLIWMPEEAGLLALLELE
jgi:hypothetical protein